MSTEHGMTAEAFSSYNAAHGIGAAALALLLAALPLLTSGRIGPTGTCAAPSSAAVAPVIGTPSSAATVPARGPEGVPTPVAPSPVAAPSAVAVSPADVPPAALLFFATSRSDLGAGADTVVSAVVSYLRAHAGAKAVITGYHDARGSQSVNTALAGNRARSVAALLNRLGIPSDRLVMDTPVETTGSGSLDEARRVEVAVRP